MRMALEEAERGVAEGNDAVGSIVVEGEAVVARGRNLVTSMSNALIVQQRRREPITDFR